jgi:hypothetical protein
MIATGQPAITFTSVAKNMPSSDAGKREFH